MKGQCPVLELVEKLAVLMDQDAKGKISKVEYYREVSNLRDGIDEAVIANCKVQQ